jgi:H+-translocating NAD(P) transhydrogenase subunit beta
MCKAMNRSLANVLFGGFGATITAGTPAMQGEVKPLTADDAYYILEAASVVVVPGYGMAVAQAQHAVKELADQLLAEPAPRCGTPSTRSPGGCRGT